MSKQSHRSTAAPELWTTESKNSALLQRTISFYFSFMAEEDERIKASLRQQCCSFRKKNTQRVEYIELNYTSSFCPWFWCWPSIRSTHLPQSAKAVTARKRVLVESNFGATSVSLGDLHSCYFLPHQHQLFFILNWYPIKSSYDTEFNKTIIALFALVEYEIGHSQLGRVGLVGYLPSHIQRTRSCDISYCWHSLKWHNFETGEKHYHGGDNASESKHDGLVCVCVCVCVV